MKDGKIETIKGMCVVDITKHLMSLQNLEFESAYKELLSLELYKLLQDSDTRLYLETNEYLEGACDTEINYGVDALYQYINDDSRG